MPRAPRVTKIAKHLSQGRLDLLVGVGRHAGQNVQLQGVGLDQVRGAIFDETARLGVHDQLGARRLGRAQAGLDHPGRDRALCVVRQKDGPGAFGGMADRAAELAFGFTIGFAGLLRIKP